MTSFLSREMRYAEPDLQITVGVKEDQKVYQYHATTMAALSTYIDRMLSCGMKESETKQISFPDIDSTIWEEMLTYLQPTSYCLPKVDRAFELAQWYDKYDFPDGRHLCDVVLECRIKDLGKQVTASYGDECKNMVMSLQAIEMANGASSTPRRLLYPSSTPGNTGFVRGFSSDNEVPIAFLQQALEVYSCAHYFGMELTKEFGIVFFAEFMMSAARKDLNIQMISMLAPMMATDDRLWSALERVMNGCLPTSPSREAIVAESCFPIMLRNTMCMSYSTKRSESRWEGF